MGAIENLRYNFTRTSIALIKILGCAVPLGFVVPAFANGFVKNPNEVYVKLSFAADKKTTEVSSSGAYDKSTYQIQGYGEFGLPLPWRAQMSIASSVRQVTRKSVEKKDSFESRGFSDTQVDLKSLVYEGELGRLIGSPLTLLFAADSGVNLPTTRKKYRSGNEAALAEGLSVERTFLVSPIDRGALQLRQGLGLSFLSAGQWLSAAHHVHADFDLSALGQTSRLELGTSLPQSSWFQVYFQNTTSRQLAAQQTYTQGGRQEENSLGLSLGYTFLPGWAAEGGVTLVNSVHFYQWSAGISYRTM
jgi:hypothetical protein